MTGFFLVMVHKGNALYIVKESCNSDHTDIMG